MTKIILIFILSVCAFSIRLRFNLEPYHQHCFYEYFYHQTKYRFAAEADGGASYQFKLNYVNTTQQKDSQTINLLHQVHTKGQGNYSEINLHKFASQQGLHEFCLKNNDASYTIFRLKLESGIELMELDVLPGANDTKLLEQQLNLLESEFKVLLDSLTSIEGSKRITQQVFQLMSGKTFGFGVIGMTVIIIVNFLFYKLIKKSLEQRKRI